MTPTRHNDAQPPAAFPAPQPVVFAPQFHPKPWGGRRLADLLHKPLPPDQPIGESWELSGLPGHESRVARGPLAGRTIQELLDAWGPALLGRAAPCDGRFPLLLKYLDARENLSVQVHPRPPEAGAPATAPVKHEAWYIVAADPGAVVYIGLRPGVTPADVIRATCSAGYQPVPRNPAGPGAPPPHPLVALLQQYPATPGRCFYLPSGTLHALGAGVVVAEVQTPSDVTYRLYDWDRRDPAGRPRALHIDQALANIRYDVDPNEIRQHQPADARGNVGSWESQNEKPLDPAPMPSVPTFPPSHVPTLPLCSCDRFTITHRTLAPGRPQACPNPDRQGGAPGHSNPLDPGRMRIWMILSGRGELLHPADGARLPFAAGETLLIPAACAGWSAASATPCSLLEIHAAE